MGSLGASRREGPERKAFEERRKGWSQTIIGCTVDLRECEDPDLPVEDLRLFHEHKGTLPERRTVAGWVENRDLAAILPWRERAEADLKIDWNDAQSRS
jgi:hypothetical protein